jgi:hypothetical protein
MFKLNNSGTYTWPVIIKSAIDGGKYEEQSFNAVFRRISQTEIYDINTKIEADHVNDIDIARLVMVGWNGVFDGDSEIPYSNENLDKLLDITGCGSAIVFAFLESLKGAKRKN